MPIYSLDPATVQPAPSTVGVFVGRAAEPISAGHFVAQNKSNGAVHLVEASLDPRLFAEIYLALNSAHTNQPVQLLRAGAVNVTPTPAFTRTGGQLLIPSTTPGQCMNGEELPVPSSNHWIALLGWTNGTSQIIVSTWNSELNISAL